VEQAIVPGNFLVGSYRPPRLFRPRRRKWAGHFRRFPFGITFDSWSPCRSMAPPARASARCAEQRRPPAPARPVSGTYARAGLKRRVPPRPGAAVKWCRACCCPPLQHRGARVARPCGKRRRWRVDARRRAEPGSWRIAPTPVGGARRGARWAPPARGVRPKGARAVGPRGAVQDACTPAVGGGLAHGSPW
jgi:hypothetical protein